MSILNKKSIVTKILIIFILILSIFKTNSNATTVSPTTDFYVNDYAKLLNDETKNYIISTNKSLYNQTGSQIVVVTVPNLDGNSLEEYATELFRNFGIGSKEKNNGVLLLLALEERQFRIEVGYGLEGVLTDGKTGRIQDEYIIPYLKQNNWNEGIKNGYSAILNIVADEYNVSVGAEDAIATNSVSSEDYQSTFEFLGLPFISMFVGNGIRWGRKKRKGMVIPFVYMAFIAMIYFVMNRNDFTVIVFGIVLNVIFLVLGLLGVWGHSGGRRTVFQEEVFLLVEAALSAEAVRLVAEEAREVFKVLI